MTNAAYPEHNKSSDVVTQLRRRLGKRFAEARPGMLYRFCSPLGESPVYDQDKAMIATIADGELALVIDVNRSDGSIWVVTQGMFVMTFIGALEQCSQ